MGYKEFWICDNCGIDCSNQNSNRIQVIQRKPVSNGGVKKHNNVFCCVKCLVDFLQKNSFHFGFNKKLKVFSVEDEEV